MKSKLSLLAFFLVITMASASNASVIVQFQQDANRVIATTVDGGTFNLTGLTYLLGAPNTFGSYIQPEVSSVVIGGNDANFLAYYYGFTGPANFGIGKGGGGRSTASGLGEQFGIAFGNSYLGVTNASPHTYSSLSSSVWSGQTYESLGITPGTYTWNWGSGANADFFQIQIAEPPSTVPEPSTYALFSLGLGGMALWKRRQKKA